MTLLVLDPAGWETGNPLSLHQDGAWANPVSLYLNVAGEWVSVYESSPVLGAAWMGGFYMGMIKYPDGSLYYLIDGGKDSEAQVAFSNVAFEVPINSLVDGVANIAALGSPIPSNFLAALYCANYRGGGFSDWFLGSFAENELRYQYLKPAATANIAGVAGNEYSVPPEPLYTTSVPTQTTVPAYQLSGAQALSVTAKPADGIYISSSSQTGTNNGTTGQSMESGNPIVAVVTTAYLVRPIRKVLVGSL